MRGKLAGSTEYITKPFDSTELVQTVEAPSSTPPPCVNAPDERAIASPSGCAGACRSLIQRDGDVARECRGLPLERNAIQRSLFHRKGVIVCPYPRFS